MSLTKIKTTDRATAPGEGFEKNLMVKAGDFNPIVDYLNDSFTPGTVTQTTAITTGVTLNSKTGVITTVSSTLAAGSNAAFTVTNSEVTTSSVIQLTWANNGAGIALMSLDAAPANGSFIIRIHNVHGANAFNNTLLIHYTVINSN